GSFHFSNTTERTLKIASELVRFGVEPARISEIVYNSYPWSRVELMRQVLGTVCRDRTGRVAWMKHTLEMDRIAGTRDGDNSGLVNYPLQAKEIVAAAYIREVGAGDYRVSVRSKGDIDVAIIAEAFGGGGHKNAAGFGIQGKLDEIECLIVGALIDSVNGLDIEAEGSLKRIELSAA
ncbi:MAG: DHH family phosphoesterase, partial [Acidobacteriota bacterium]